MVKQKSRNIILPLLLVVTMKKQAGVLLSKVGSGYYIIQDTKTFPKCYVGRNGK